MDNSTTKKKLDANDLHQKHGLDYLKDQVKEVRLGVDKKGSELDAVLSDSSTEMPSEKTAMLPSATSKKNESTLKDAFPWDLDNPCAEFSLTNKGFPSLLENHANEIFKITSNHEILAFNSMLSAIAAVINVGMYHQFLTKHRIYPNFWMLHLGPSGSRKSTAMENGWNIAMRGEIEAVKRCKEIPGADIDSESERKKILAMSNVLPSDGSFAGLEERLALGQRGVKYIDEFSQYYSYLTSRTNIGAIPKMASYYAVPEYKVGATKTSGTLIIERSFITLCAISTIEWLENSVSQQDVLGGFWPRFLLYMLDHTEKELPLFEVDNIEFNTIYEEQIINKLRLFTENRDLSTEYMLTPGAKALCKEIFAINRERFAKEPCHHLLDKFRERIIANVIRIALPIEFVASHNKPFITEDSIWAAYSVVHPALCSTAKVFNEVFLRSNARKRIDKLKEYIITTVAKKKITAPHGDMRINYRNITQTHIYDRSIDYGQALELLEDEGVIEIEGKESKFKKDKFVRLL